MTVGGALRQASKVLSAHNFEDASLEVEVLLMHVLGTDRAALYCMLRHELPDRDLGVFAALVCRRLSHEPLAYITGHREFFGYDFNIMPGVLVPRPESELLVEEAFEHVERHFPDRAPAIADIGTGSGAIAVTLALLLPQSICYATDISPRALKIARVNCERYGVQDRVSLLCGDLLAPLPEPVDVVVANLPYVTEAQYHYLQDEVRMFEPVEALIGGGDGLDVVRRLVGNLGYGLRPGGIAFVEIGDSQSEALASLVQKLLPGVSLEFICDLAGKDRVAKIGLS